MSLTALAPSQGELAQPEARRLTDQIRLGLDSVWELALQAWEGQAWKALGYACWDDYCTREFGSCRLRLPRQDRDEAIAPLLAAGMSTRAIASLTGVHDRTIRRALTATPGPARDRVAGRDGRDYPARRPTKSSLLLRQANAARLRNEGLTQTEIAQRLGVAQATVSADLAEIDRLTGAVADVGTVLDDARDAAGRTDPQAVAQRLGVGQVSGRDLARLCRQPVRDLEATVAVLVQEVVLADEWLLAGQRSAALDLLLPMLERLLGQLSTIVDSIEHADRQAPQWAAVREAAARLAAGCAREPA